MNLAEVKKFLPCRKKDAHKYDFGHLLILAGSVGMTGAATLTAQAAMRIGTGLVTLGIPESLNDILEIKLTEVMTLPLPETNQRSLDKKTLDKILFFIKNRKVNTVAIGPGLSQNKSTQILVRQIVKNTSLPMVIDADGLSAFTDNLSLLSQHCILTPHCGELARLLGKESVALQNNRVNYAKNFAQKTGVICVLKGYQTVVTDGKNVFINPTGNPGMATAGSGDVLTGMIAGLLAQRIEKFTAAKIGVYLHGFIGNLVKKEKGEMGLIASDLVEEIPRVMAKLRR